MEVKSLATELLATEQTLLGKTVLEILCSPS